MPHAFRQLTIALALSAGTLAVMAAPVTIKLDFETLGAAAIANKVASKVTLLEGLSFSGAYAYGYSLAEDGGIEPGPTNKTGFLINRPGPSVTVSPISISLASYPGRYFESIDFIFATNATNPSLRGYDANNLLVKDNLPLKGGNVLMPWSSAGDPAFSFNGLKVTRLEFFNNGAQLSLDDLDITLTDTDAGGIVPEPASFALVALALLAAGGASRRRS